MKKKNEILVIEESAVVKNQESEIPMLAAGNGSENYVDCLLVKIIVSLLFCYLN